MTGKSSTRKRANPSIRCGSWLWISPLWKTGSLGVGGTSRLALGNLLLCHTCRIILQRYTDVCLREFDTIYMQSSWRSDLGMRCGWWYLFWYRHIGKIAASSIGDGSKVDLFGGRTNKDVPVRKEFSSFQKTRGSIFKNTFSNPPSPTFVFQFVKGRFRLRSVADVPTTIRYVHTHRTFGPTDFSHFCNKSLWTNFFRTKGPET